MKQSYGFKHTQLSRGRILVTITESKKTPTKNNSFKKCHDRSGTRTHATSAVIGILDQHLNHSAILSTYKMLSSFQFNFNILEIFSINSLDG